MFDVTSFHGWLRLSHIVIGAIGLAAFWVPIFSKKGGQTHLWFGKLFAATGYLVVATALTSCIWGLIDPISFAGITREVGDQELFAISQQIRFFLGLLGMLSLWLLSALEMGIGVVKTKKNPERLRCWRQYAAHGLSGIASLAFTIYGLVNLAVSGNAINYLAIFLGLFGLSASIRFLRFLHFPRPTRMAWWYMHMECMLGAGIAFHTAFFVFGMNRLLPLQLTGAYALIPWFLPAAIGIPVTQIWVRYYKRKFQEDGPKPLPSVELEPATAEK